MKTMSRQEPSAPPLIHGVIYVTPIRAWNDFPLDPPPPYSERPTPPSENRRSENHARTLPLQPGYRQTNAVDVNHCLSATHSNVVAHESNTMKAPTKINKEYFLSNFALMKAMEFITCLIGVSACITFRLELGLSPSSVERSSFFIILLTLCCLLVIIVFCMNLTGHLNGIQNESSFAKTMVVHISVGGLLLVSTSLLADIQVNHLCVSEDAVCLAYKISLGSGFLTMLLFWIDAALQCAAYKARRLTLERQ